MSQPTPDANVTADYLGTDQGYEARGIVARVQPIGHYQDSVLLRLPVYKFLTLDRGAGQKGMAVQFVGAASFIEENGERFLDTRRLKPGHIIVHPGFIYKKITMTGMLMAEHLKALKTYRRKDIIQADRQTDESESIDMGIMDFTKDKVSKALKGETRH